ncbi:hypothetical protein Pla163_30970 [Planctomycetes bacterium Pla163]|uniref:Uncharacterized protein n=1 Tax=Rohdeia mirabilis TaxID=2528008 RepID=A0A518D392_9BACT|nr:hypothetical protein Pla163_30970 [Planctomycetes bacterium Pla163]
MAAPRKRSTGGRSARSTTSRKPAAAARPGRGKSKDDDVEDPDSGIGWEGGIGIVTFLVLIAAILILDNQLGTLYPGEGFFFGNQ